MTSLYEKTSKKVHGFILSIVKNKHDAEDVLHDTYVTIYKASKNYKTSGRPLSWILSIARNLSLLKLREKRREVSISYEDIEEFDVNQNFSIEEKIVIQEFLKILSEEEREIVYLHAVMGFKHREIASIVGLSLPNVLSKYHRALKKLRKEIGDKYET